jgi:hypothetical protein
MNRLSPELLNSPPLSVIFQYESSLMFLRRPQPLVAPRPPLLG